ncbi:hypothetical protein BN000_03567 [Mycobacterium europaeum]|uniref:Uncharacterized protein n=1 Tax=Mycobacterium europaeum TaxID=761804 RepID=A0A0U1DJB2_9MYCO|nr:hypothetical protein BN000_03567 [Mycobacterium europaeum]
MIGTGNLFVCNRIKPCTPNVCDSAALPDYTGSGGSRRWGPPDGWSCGCNRMQ